MKINRIQATSFRGFSTEPSLKKLTNTFVEPPQKFTQKLTEFYSTIEDSEFVDVILPEKGDKYDSTKICIELKKPFKTSDGAILPAGIRIFPSIYFNDWRVDRKGNFELRFIVNNDGKETFEKIKYDFGDKKFARLMENVMDGEYTHDNVPGLAVFFEVVGKRDAVLKERAEQFEDMRRRGCSNEDIAYTIAMVAVPKLEYYYEN